MHFRSISYLDASDMLMDAFVMHSADEVGIGRLVVLTLVLKQSQVQKNEKLSGVNHIRSTLFDFFYPYQVAWSNLGAGCNIFCSAEGRKIN